MTPRTALAHKKAVFPRMNARVFRPAVGALCALMLTAAAAHAQPIATPAAMSIAPPQNVLQLSANGQVEVQQDLLTLSLTTSREGADAAEDHQAGRHRIQRPGVANLIVFTGSFYFVDNIK